MSGKEKHRDSLSLGMPQDASSHLPLGSLGIGTAFPGNNKSGPFQQLIKADSLQHSLNSALERSPEEGLESPAKASGRAGRIREGS